MSGFESTGKILIGIGIFIVLFGLLLMFGGKLPLVGRLPGDIVIHRGDSTFYFPLVTGLIISLVLTVILNVVFRIFK